MELINRLIVALKRRKKYLLVFSSGFVLALSLYFYSEDLYERQIFSALAQKVMEPSSLSSTVSQNTDSQLIKSMNLVHYLGAPRQAIFENKEFSSIKSSLIEPATFDLMTNKGACGSYAFVLGRLLNQMDIPVRFAQMLVNGVYGGHIVLEAKISSGWVVLDPTYNVYFVRPDGRLASFADVQANWERYSQQVPKFYDYKYSYDGVRYTNWQKIPVLMPMMKKALILVKGRKAVEEISLRSLFLRKFYVLFSSSFMLFILLSFFMLRPYIRRSIKYFTPRKVRKTKQTSFQLEHS